MKRGTSNSTKLQKRFGETIRRRRQALDISQEELAARSGLHRTYISQIERGLKSASLKAIVALAKALRVTADVLVREASSSS